MHIKKFALEPFNNLIRDITIFNQIVPWRQIEFEAKDMLSQLN